MGLLQSITIAIFCMIVVFAVLVALWAVIRLFSMAIRFFEKNGAAPSSSDRQI